MSANKVVRPVAARSATVDLKEEPYEIVSMDVKAPAVIAAGASSKVASGLKRGLKPLRITMPFSFSSTASTTGVLTAVLSVKADSNTTEWASLLTLYDEYRMTGGVVRYFLPTQTAAPGTAGLGPDNMHVMCWDPLDPTALGSVREGCENAQHKLIVPSLIAAGATDAKTALFGYRNAQSEPFQFRFKVAGAQATAINSSGAVNSTPGMWKLMNAAGSNLPDGYIKQYSNVSATGSATIACAGILYLDMEFRSRK